MATATENSPAKALIMKAITEAMEAAQAFRLDTGHPERSLGCYATVAVMVGHLVELVEVEHAVPTRDEPTMAAMEEMVAAGWDVEIREGQLGVPFTCHLGKGPSVAAFEAQGDTAARAIRGTYHRWKASGSLGA